MQYDKICLMVPTYKRPDRVKKLITSAMKNAEDVSRLRFSFCVNKKDTETIIALDELYWPNDLYWEIVFESTRQPNLSMYFNLMYDKTRFNDAGTLVSMLGDDMVFATRGWDTKVLSAMNAADGKAIVYCDDAYIAHDKLCVNLFTSRLVVDATGLPFMCTKYHAEMIDVVWMSVGQITGILKYLPDVTIRHEHDSGKKESQWDETFRRLQPIRNDANKEHNKKHAVIWSTVAAANLIAKGIGKWNQL